MTYKTKDNVFHGNMIHHLPSMQLLSPLVMVHLFKEV